MGQLAVGDVVLVGFPFSDLKGRKLRPALVIGLAERGDLILCQITSKPYASQLAVRLETTDFATGRLPVVSFARPDKLFTADRSIVERQIARLKKTKLLAVTGAVKGLLSTRPDW